ncbi:MAG: electron transfer flavoprotein subunit alpha/FixB family protein [Sphingomonadales bacterium]|jgi:electron transfer flavoprotein alpha subunit
MSVIVFAETRDQQYKKSTLEAVSYGKEVATKTGGKVIAVSIGNASDPASLGNYGADEVITLHGAEFGSFSPEIYAAAFAEVCKNHGGKTIIISNTYSGKSIAGRVAILLQGALATNVVDYPDTTSGFRVKRGVFSGKAFAYVEMLSATKILAITPNSVEIKTHGSSAAVTAHQPSALPSSSTKIESTQTVSGKVPLTEAEIVVSAGRGMKGPENWNMVEELATALGAATACSKPVSDMHWRPHSEHVGQTGITIKPNLYIAIGISGAIQHLAGVSSSKVIVVINKDAEAPFFKAADYGIVGDAFDVLPKLIQAAKSTAAS